MFNFYQQYLQNEFKSQGWVHIKSAIPFILVVELSKRAVKWRDWVDDKVGQPAKKGPPVHWRGLGCAGAYDEYLMNFYRSDLMHEYAKALLDTQKVWLYNDQIVVKLPHDNFEFKTHTDNETEGINSVNCCVILDHFTEQNGGLVVDGNTLYPNAGDIVAIHGDTPHSSKPNISDFPRSLYACVYADSKIHFQNYYRTPFTSDPLKQDLL